MIKEMFELKKWNEYSKEEKITLLMQWWLFHNEEMVTIEECVQFQQLLEKEYDQVFTHAVVSNVQGVGIKNLVNWMRMNVAEELLAKIPKVENIPDMEFRKLHAQAETLFLTKLVQSYNATKPIV